MVPKPNAAGRLWRVAFGEALAAITAVGRPRSEPPLARAPTRLNSSIRSRSRSASSRPRQQDPTGPTPAGNPCHSSSNESYVDVAVAKIGLRDAAALLQARERDSVLADHNAKPGLRVAQCKTNKFHRDFAPQGSRNQNSTSIPRAFATL
jgi:hypothetical protein